MDIYLLHGKFSSVLIQLDFKSILNVGHLLIINLKTVPVTFDCHLTLFHTVLKLTWCT